MLRKVASPLLGTLCALALAGLPPEPAAAQDKPFSAPDDFSEMVEARLPAVVGIIATGPAVNDPQGAGPALPPGFEDFFGLPGPQVPSGPRQALGSGFVISEDGYVVTNNHVIDSATEIEVVVGEDRTIPAELVGADPATDIALLQLGEDADLPAVQWGNSRDLEIGQWVVAIGNPFGLGGTVTAGIVSGRSRDINSGPYDDFIQTDAAINSGNSGGPLFNAEGDVIGVNTAIFSPSGGNVGVGFAVPAHVAERIVADLKDDGQVERGWLGVRIQGISDEIAEALDLPDASGALINEVTPGGPAEEAGVQSGDVLISVNGEAIDDPRALVFAIADQQIGETATLTVLRDGERQKLEVEIGRQPGNVMQASRPGPSSAGGDPKLGAGVAAITPELRAQFGLPDNVAGLVVVDVSRDGAAATAGLRRGDVIVEAGGEPVADVAAIRTALDAAQEAGRPALLRVFRDGAYRFVAVPLASSEG